MLNDDFSKHESGRPRHFLESLGVKADGEGRLILEVAETHLRSLGLVHGGVIATLLDSVMGMAAARSSPVEHYLVTAQLNVNFIRPALDGETLIAFADVRHVGRRTAVAQGEIRTDSGSLVATSSATFVYVAHDDRTRGQSESISTSN
ncbi:PaaI family thioesterase [Tundrisphaera lichenicola]|uniref:PaaI family thioesterase n=1 Tax=Tundrisphaera lichenicola TaxID=2029860 RepID=UPI003EBD2CF5